MDRCANYLLNHTAVLHYQHCLAAGLPIATGVIEGACRYLVKDRMELTGARWSLLGAEAVLRLRALHASGNFDEYWHFHLACEQQRNHLMLYKTGFPLMQRLTCSKLQHSRRTNQRKTRQPTSTQLSIRPNNAGV